MPVAITGFGSVNAFGDATSFLDAVLQGRTVVEHARPEVSPPELVFPREAPVLRIAPPDPRALGGLSPPYPDKIALMAIASADEAMNAAGLRKGTLAPERIGLVVSTSYGPSLTVDKYLRTLVTSGPSAVSPILFSRTVANASLGAIARRYSLLGPSTLVMGAFTLGYAIDLLRTQRADAVLCVGLDTLSDNVPWAYCRAGMYDHGLVLGEAAAAIVVERADSAAMRRAESCADVIDQVAVACPEAVQRITDFDRGSIADGMRVAMQRTHTNIGDVSLVVSADNGHAPLVAAEESAIHAVLEGREVGVTRPKRVLGETFAAAELLGVIAAARALPSERRSRAIVNTIQLGGQFSATVVERGVG